MLQVLRRFHGLRQDLLRTILGEHLDQQHALPLGHVMEASRIIQSTQKVSRRDVAPPRGVCIAEKFDEKR